MEVFGVEDDTVKEVFSMKVDEYEDEEEDEDKDEDEDEKVLVYDSVVLRRSDLNLLRGPRYLNDCIIEFYFCYLNSLHQSSMTNSRDILLISPTLSFWLANCQDFESSKAFEESHEVAQKQLVLFTVNNNQDVSKIDGGTHWSLLVYYRKPNAFVHYDSAGSLNRLVARRLYEAVKKHVAAPPSSAHHHNNYYHCDHQHDHNGHHDDHDHEYPSYSEELRMPQQTNLYDCGLYVMAIARVICEWYYASYDSTTGTSNDDDDDGNYVSNHGSGVGGWFLNITKHVDNSLESTMRDDLLTLIQQLKSHSTTFHAPQPQQSNSPADFASEKTITWWKDGYTYSTASLIIQVQYFFHRFRLLLFKWLHCSSDQVAHCLAKFFLICSCFSNLD